jgi:GT2 family glycosyltransferase
VLARFLVEPELLSTLRAGIPSVRTIEDDVASTRALYPAHHRGHRESLRPMRLVAIVLNYGTPDDTWLTVRSLLGSRQKIDEIVVVNNDEADVDRQRLSQNLRSLDPAVTIVDTGRNLGFSGGMNVGIRRALDQGATHVLLVNSDVVVPPDCVGHLERGLETEPGSGIAGPVVLSRSNPDQIASLGMSYALRSGRMRHRGYGEPAGSLNLPPHLKVDAVGGCLILVAREVFDTVGLFDEDYFFTFEDLDFCLRASTAGFSTVLVASARVYHEGSRSIGAHSPSRLYYAARNHLLVAARTDPSRGRLARLWRASSIIGLNLAHAATTGSGPLPVRLGAVIRGTRDYLQKKTGAEISR